MCRHLAYVGSPITLQSLLIDPVHSLVQQSWAPRFQISGIMNVDGFGVGWYQRDSSGQTPARYRRDRPIWTDAGFSDLARVTSSPAILAAVRSASPGLPFGEAACAPFAHERWLFSLNGSLEGYPDKAAPLLDHLDSARLLQMEAATDSALLWLLVRAQLDGGAALGDALGSVARLTTAHCDGRFNLLLTDGVEIAATVIGNSLFWRTTSDSIVVASEPHDDDEGWTRVPDQSLLTASLVDGVTVVSL